MRTACSGCGFPRPGGVGRVGDTDCRDSEDLAWQAKCPHCRRIQPQFDRVVSLWSYRDRVRDAVIAAKYARNSFLASALGNRLGEAVASRLSDDFPDFVTFVPSHLTRQLSRGGNHGEVMGRAVARVLGRRCCPLLRVRRRLSKQAWLDDEARRENVGDAFVAKKSYPWTRSPRIADLHILVVDDVLTTGATANEVARALRGGGAGRVSLAVVARAVRH